MEIQNEDSLKKRYAAKLSTNLIGFAIGLITQSIIPRGLGPKAYGDFSFISSFFTQLMPFFSLSTSACFYTRLSQRQNDSGLISFYFQFTGISFIVLFIFVLTSHAAGLSDSLWLGLNIKYVYMAAVWSLLVWIATLLTQISDAYGLTISTEIAKIVQAFIGMAIILALFFFNQLDLTNFFYYQYAIFLLLIVLFVWIIKQNRSLFFHNWRLKKEQIKKYTKEFYEYSHPLFVYAFIGMIVVIFDRWILQKFAGSVQQGFFGLSAQIGAVCFLFTSALTSLITREFSIAYRHNNINEMARLFRRYIPLLYGIAAFFGCFACIQADKITCLFGGSKFAGAALPVAIMALYPIHQTYGQLSGSIFYATGQTGLYRNIGLIFMFIGLPIAYFLIAPVDMMGLNTGSTGLAVKMVVLQFIAVNVQLYFNSTLLKLPFLRYLLHQILSVGVLLAIASLSAFVINSIPELESKVVVNFIISGILYTLMVTASTILFPKIFGLKCDDISLIVAKVKVCYQKK